MKMGSVSERLNERAWLRDWPSQAVRDFEESALSLAPHEGYHRLQQTCQAAFGKAEDPVSIQEVQDLLDRLDAWNRRHSSVLSWPPVVDGFLKAIARDIEGQHQDLVLMNILVPAMVARAMRAHAQPAASVSPPPEPTAQAQPAPPATPARNAHPSTVREPTTHPPRSAASPDLALKLLEIVNANPGGIASEKIDATIKSMVAAQVSSDPTRLSSARFKFFIKDLMPSLAMLDPAQIQAIMQCWPANATVEIARPEALLSRSDFWVSMKAGGPESRIAVMSHVLPRLFNGDGWSPEKSLEALQQMMARVRSPEEFTRRLDLWHAWGGNLDSPIIKTDPDGVDGFAAASSGPTTARSWIEETMPAHKDHLPSSRRSPKGP